MHTTPFLRILIPYICGIITGYYCNVQYPFFLTVLLLASIILCVISIKTKPERQLVFLLLSFFYFGILNVHYYYHHIPRDSIQNMVSGNTKGTFTCTVKEYPVAIRIDSLNRMKVSLHSISTFGHTERCSGTLYIYFNSIPEPVAPGDVVAITGRIRFPPYPRNPGEPNLKNIFKLKGVHASIFHPSEITVIKRNMLRSLVFHLRKDLKEHIDTFYPKETAPFITSLILGIRNEISHEQWTYFQGSGTIHILAISGLHMGLFIGIAYLILTVLRIDFRLRTIILLVLTIAYMYISGLKIPVIRTSIMLIIYFSSILLSRKSNIYNTLSAAAFLILLVSPVQLFVPGFILSFTAILSLLHISPLIKKLFISEKTEIERLLQKKHPFMTFAKTAVLNSLFISSAAWLGTFPIIIAFFNIITPYAIVANFFVIPFVAVILASGFLFLLLQAIIPALGIPFAVIGSFCTKTLIYIVQTFSSLPGSVIYLRSFPVLLYYMLLISAIILFKKKPDISKRKQYITILFIFNMIFIYTAVESFLLKEDKVIHILDVGHGDCSVIETGKSVIMIDTGSSRKEFSVKNFLKKRGIKTIDILILSHFDEDHCGNARMLLDQFSVGKILFSIPPFKGNEAYEKITEALENSRTQLLEAETLKAIHLGDTIISIFSPLLPPRYSPNDRSLVIKVTLNGKSFLFTGDIENAGIQVLLNSAARIECDILKAPHHGRYYSNSELLIKACSPSVVILPQHSLDEPYSARTVYLLKQREIKYYSTARSGYIKIDLNKGIKVKGFLDDSKQKKSTNRGKGKRQR